MGLSSIIRGAGRGATSVGRAVQAATQKLDQAFTGAPQPAAVDPLAQAAAVAPPAQVPGAQPAPITPTEGAQAASAPAPGAAPAGPAQKGFALPDLGNPPDQSAADFQGEGGAQKYADAVQDYEHKKDIHDAFVELDSIYSQAHPGRNFQKEYQDQLAEQKAHEKERPSGNPLARAALALGDFNPAVQQSGRSGLSEYDSSVERAGARSDQSFSQRMALKSKMYETEASDAQAQGNWKKALAAQEKLALLKADEDAIGHRRDMEKIGAQQKGATERANIRRDSAERVANTRARVISDSHGLTGNFLKTFEKEAAKAVARMLGPRDLTKEYSPADLDGLTDYIEQLAEMFHDQQYGDGSAEKYPSTHPAKRPQPKNNSEKEEF